MHSFSRDYRSDSSFLYVLAYNSYLDFHSLYQISFDKSVLPFQSCAKVFFDKQSDFKKKILWKPWNNKSFKKLFHKFQKQPEYRGFEIMVKQNKLPSWK